MLETRHVPPRPLDIFCTAITCNIGQQLASNPGMTQVYDIKKQAELLTGNEEAEQFVENVALLLGVSGDYASVWDVANDVCDRHGLGIAA